MRKAIFLDRDGTLNRDHGYTHKAEDWEWLPGVLEALRILHDAGWFLVAASNQSGIGRGYYSREQLAALEAWLTRELKRQNCAIDAWYYCPHRPEENCACRKPEPGLILQAAKKHDIDLARSWMLGDRLKDAQAGLAAGCKAGIVLNPDYEDEAARARRLMPEIKIWPDLLAAAQDIVRVNL